MKCKAHGGAQDPYPALGRESHYNALSPEGNPEFATIMRVVSALGLELHATSA